MNAMLDHKTNIMQFLNETPTTPKPTTEEPASQIEQLKADMQTVSEKIHAFQLSYAVTVDSAQSTPQPTKLVWPQ
jgi:hypothetical protein